MASLVSSPDGWVVDNEDTKNRKGFQFSMYSLGHTRESAMRHGAFLYGNMVLKSVDEPTMETIAERHEKAVIHEIPSARFERLDPVVLNGHAGREPSKTLFRIGHIQAPYKGPEYSLYLDHPGGVLILVLLWATNYLTNPPF